MSERLDYLSVAPGVGKALGGVYGYVAQSGLGKPLLDLVYLRCSLINGCAYCIDAHTSDLLHGGMDPAKLALVPVWREAAEAFDAREQSALAWAETVTRVAKNHVPDADFAAARAVFTDKELADLTAAIGLINVYNRLAISFRKPPAALARLGAKA